MKVPSPPPLQGVAGDPCRHRVCGVAAYALRGIAAVLLDPAVGGRPGEDTKRSAAFSREARRCRSPAHVRRLTSSARRPALFNSGDSRLSKSRRVGVPLRPFASVGIKPAGLWPEASDVQRSGLGRHGLEHGNLLTLSNRSGGRPFRSHAFIRSAGLRLGCCFLRRDALVVRCSICRRSPSWI